MQDARMQHEGGRRPQGENARWTELALAGSVLSVLALASTWPLTKHLGSALPSDLADPLLNAFTLAWGADRLRGGLRGFWDAPFFFPLSGALARSEHLLGITVFTAPVQWATGNAVLAYNLAFLGSYVLAGTGAYLLARSLWQSRVAAWVAAIAFAFAPHRVAHVSHLQMLMSGWTPLALWGLHRYARTASRRGLATFAAATLLQALSCSYLMYFFLLPAGLVALGEIVRRRSGSAVASAPRPLRLAGGLALATVVVVAALAPVARAYLEVRGATGFRRSLGDMLLFSASPSDYWHIPHLAAWNGVLPPGHPERELFPGLAVTALAAAAVALALARWRRPPGPEDRDARWVTVLYATVLAAAVWLSFGPSVPGPYTWLVRWLPGFDGLRVPARFGVVVALALAVLAGGAVARAARGMRARSSALMAAAISALILVEGYRGPMPLAAFDAGQRHRHGLNAWLRAAPPGGLLELPAAGPAFEPFTTEYQFNTLFHGRAVVNGYSGTGYALQDFVAGPASPLEDPQEVGPLLRGLRALGVRYVVLHLGSYAQRHGDEAARTLAQAIEGQDDQLSARARFGDAIAWRLAGVTGANLPPRLAGELIPGTTLRASASAWSDEARFVLDGDTGTRWTSGRAQAGGEWLRVELPREMDVGQLVLRFDRYGHRDRPRGLEVVSEESGGELRVMLNDSILPPMVQAIAQNGSLAPVVIDLPANRSRAITLRQTGQAPSWYWSVHELELRRRR